jgi:DNA-binding XRE family transcriptional regulator
MAVELLTYANREKVAQALTAQGYEVTRQTVNRWARGDEMPTVAAQMIARLFGHTEEAAPGVPERLNKIDMYLRAIATAAGVPIAELEKIEESHRLVQGITPGRRRSGATRP